MFNSVNQIKDSEFDVLVTWYKKIIYGYHQIQFLMKYNALYDTHSI